MKHLAIIALLAVLPLLVLSQGLSEAELNAELDKMYQASKAQAQAPAAAPAAPVVQQPSVQVNVQAKNEAQANSNSAATAGAAATVQKQPTTVIEAAPLMESRAERIRKARQESELLTEQAIVEKLEQSRMEDEKRRAEVLFGDRFHQMNNPTPTTVPPVVAAPVAPVPVVVQEQAVKEPTLSKEEVRGEVRAALDEMKQKEEPKPERKTYFTVMGGMGDYDAKNIQGNYSLGLAFGQKVNDRFLVEGSFSYANYYVQQRDNYDYFGNPCGYYGGYNCYPRITNLNQYGLAGVMKYQFLTGMFRPVVGGLAQYTYRTYADSQFAISNNEASSHALDMGVLAGGEVEATETLAIGLEFRYLWNITYRTSNNGLIQNIVKTTGNGSDKPVESWGQSQINLYTRMSF